MTTQSFSLDQLDGSYWRYSGRPEHGKLLVVFFAVDCPTCGLALSYLSRLHEAVADRGTFVVCISQDDRRSTSRLAESLDLQCPILLDRRLEVSRLFDPVSVPTTVLIDADGNIERTDHGFSKKVLNELSAAVCSHCQREPFVVAPPHDGRPDWKPGCSSRHREPSFAGDVATPLSMAAASQAKYAEPASRITLDDTVDPLDYCMEAGFDPLPVVPPTLDRVNRMLDQVALEPTLVIGRIPPCYGAATVEKIAANAVMAGCVPDMMRILVTAVRASCDERLNLHGFQATTHFAAPLCIVNGPIRNQLGFISTQNVFSNASRANSSLGRALQLIYRNIGGADPCSIDMSTLGNPGKFSFCIAENEESSPWEPLHVESGFRAEQSAISLCAAESPRGVSEHTSRTAKGVVRSIAHCLATAWNYRACLGQRAVVIVGLEHAATCAADGYTKQDMREALFELSGVPVRWYEGEYGDGGEGTQQTKLYDRVTIDGEACYRKFQSPEAITIVVTGGTAGKFSAVLGGWGQQNLGSEMVTYPIDELAQSVPLKSQS